MTHKTVKATELQVGDVLCPYDSLHFHYPITQLETFKSGRVGIYVLSTFNAYDPTTLFTVVTD